MTTFHPQKLALTSPTSGGGGRSVGIVRSRSQATEFYERRFRSGMSQMREMHIDKNCFRQNSREVHNIPSKHQVIADGKCD
jgi:hypothetical protein